MDSLSAGNQKKRRILAAGGTGFVGSALVDRLVSEGHFVRILSRGERSLSSRDDSSVEMITGDIRDPEALMAAVEDMDTVIHLVGIIHERPERGITFEEIHLRGTANLIAAAQKAGVGRFIYVSALGARPTAATRYHLTKWAAEEMIRESGIPYVIHRPSLIVGRGNPFFDRLDSLSRFSPILPLISRGDTRFRPIALANVVEAVTRSLTEDHLLGKTIEEGGPEVLTLNQMARTLLEARHRRRAVVNIPIWIGRLTAPLMERLPSPPYTREQLVILMEGNTCHIETFQHLIPMRLLGLRESL